VHRAITSERRADLRIPAAWCCASVDLVSDAAYVEQPAARDLRADVTCTWTGHIGRTGERYTDRILPDACLDLIWDGTRLFVAGPDTGPVPFTARPGATFIGLRFRPGHAPPALGSPASALRDQRPELEDLWGAAPARVLAERLAGVEPPAATAILESAVRERMAAAPPADHLIDGLVAALTAPMQPGPGLVAALARHLGVTERSLHRRCSAAVGYGPKTLDRVLRFRRALDLGHAGTAANLGAVAATAGYADQAHFVRESRRLAGQIPSELFKPPR
jgi:AraC-like DNA-binding protein